MKQNKVKSSSRSTCITRGRFHEDSNKGIADIRTEHAAVTRKSSSPSDYAATRNSQEDAGQTIANVAMESAPSNLNSQENACQTITNVVMESSIIIHQGDAGRTITNITIVNNSVATLLAIATPGGDSLLDKDTEMENYKPSIHPSYDLYASFFDEPFDPTSSNSQQ